MPFHHRHLSILCLAFAVPLLAQEQKTTKTDSKPAPRAPLTIRTADKEVAEGMAHGFQVQGELPDPKDGHFEISIDDGGKAKVAAAAGSAGYMEVVARPGALMDIYADKIDEYRGRIQGVMMLGLQQSGMKPKDAGKMVQSILDFPKQIDTFEMRISNNPDRAKSEGMDIDIALVPTMGTWLAELAATLKPSAQGAPQLGADEGMMSFAVAVDPAGLAKLMAPFLDVSVAMSGKGGEEAKRLAAFLPKGLECSDGTIAMRWGRDGATIISGLRDPKAYQELMNTAEGRAMLTNAGGASMDVEIKEKALEHRGASVTKLIMKPKEDAPPSLLTGDGSPSEGYFAVVGNYVVASFLTHGDKDIKALIDQASEQKIKRAPLPGGTVATLGLAVATLVSTMHGAPADDAPDHMSVALARTQSGIGIKIHAK